MPRLHPSHSEPKSSSTICDTVRGASPWLALKLVTRPLRQQLSPSPAVPIHNVPASSRCSVRTEVLPDNSFVMEVRISPASRTIFKPLANVPTHKPPSG